MGNHKVTAADVKRAHRAFQRREPRDLFYRAATELVGMALRRATSLTVAEALAVLLQTWNRAYYRYRGFDSAHFASIEGLLSKHKTALERFRKRCIDDLDRRDGAAIKSLFEAFEKVLGPVGAAKALHLLAPRLFPLWDRAIADAYDLSLGEAGSNGDRYWQFVLISQRQCSELTRTYRTCANPLKSIDEYNYCKYSKEWV